MSIIRKSKYLLVISLTFLSYFSLSTKPSFSYDIKYIENMNGLIEKVKYERDGISNNLPSSIVIAQAILESGWGKSHAAKMKQNHLGLSHKGKTISFQTKKECIEFYFDNLDDNSSYKGLRKKLISQKTRVNTLVYSLASNYAKDTNYPKKILKIIDSYGLNQYD
jgi:flagellum-specific peptidoglycan hydrolase FlgJ